MDALIDMFHLKTDLALSRLLDVEPTVISKIRNRHAPVGAALLIRMHDASDLTIGELCGLMGDRRKKIRMGFKYSKPKQD
ncbi:hypothetical protein [Collimonas silvisoli]|uniref:hypothetical protein n=1 Tax=Collimonas silvisoli TaxID=2825884 RepID=UPI001B8ADFD6|nr:hypothetical protein [Collimonas silvisoli]